MSEENKVVVDEEFGMNPPEIAETDPKPEETSQVAKIYSFEDVKAKLEKEKTDKLTPKTDGLIDKTIEYFEKRCSEDSGLTQDIMQEHKTWAKCYKFCEARAKKKASSGSHGVAIEGEELLEWIEDYYRKDDKAEAEKEAKEAAERKKKAEESRRKREEEAKKKRAENRKKKATAEKDKPEEKPKQDETPKPKPKPKKSDQIDGQMDLFSMFG